MDLPGYQLHPLRGNLKGFRGVTIAALLVLIIGIVISLPSLAPSDPFNFFRSAIFLLGGSTKTATSSAIFKEQPCLCFGDRRTGVILGVPIVAT